MQWLWQFRVRLTWAAAIVVLSATAVVADTMAWHITSQYPYIVYVTFYTDSGDHEWPDGDNLYTIKDSAEHVYRLECQYAGQKICFGVSDSTNVDSYRHYWGVGIANKESCTDCCHTCDGDTDVYHTLNP